LNTLIVNNAGKRNGEFARCRATNEYYFAWWNLENLSDVEDSADRPDYLKDQLEDELRGWTVQITPRKLEN